MVAAGPASQARAGAARHQQQQAGNGAHAADHSKATASPYSRSATKPRARKQTAHAQMGAAGSGSQRTAAGGAAVEESEDRRIKLLTESVLYDLLPAALQIMLPQTGEEAAQQEPDMDKCRAVASAAMCVACLLNTPPGFLEFLLCVPWRKLSELFPKSESIDKLISNLHVTEDERRRLVNTRIDPALMSEVLEFLYRADHVDSLPPMLQLSKQPHASVATPSGQPGSGSQPSSGSAVPPRQAAAAAAPGAGSAGADAGQLLIVMETVAALLDGATPLHCAALRGNPAQVDHLLACGADPSMRTAAGELPLEMVPVCSEFDFESGQRVCRCMGPLDQEVWECRSSLARSLVARQSLLFFRRGLFTWLQMVLLSLLCWFGYWGWHTSISRPAVEHHVVSCRERKRLEARSRAQGLMSRMRTEAQQGHLHLSTAKQEYIAALGKPPPDKSFDPTLPNGHASSDMSGMTQQPATDRAGVHCTTSSIQGLGLGTSGGPNIAVVAAAAADAVAGGPSGGSSSSSSEQGAGASIDKGGGAAAAPTLCRCSVALVAAGKLKEANVQEGSSCFGGEGSACEAAFRCFVVAVHSLQGLDLQGDTVPKVLTDTVDVADESYQTHVLEDEQADLYCSWSESVLLKFRSCSCPSCTALTVQAVRMAHIQCARLFARVEQRKAQMPGRWLSVGQSLARAIFTHICLLLDTEARLSPTKASLWRSEQCLREWSKLAAQGLAPSPGEWAGPAPPDGARGEAWVGVDLAKVEELQQWTRHADSDLYLAEALLGSPLGTGQPLSEALALAVTRLPTGEAYLTRPATSEVLQQLDQAITLACSPSPEVGQLARSVALCCSEEQAAAARLRDAVNGRGLPARTLDAAAVLAEAIEGATAFPRLVADVEAARELHARWLRRSEAVDRLDTVVEAVRQYTLSFPLSMLVRGDRATDGQDRAGPSSGGSGTQGGGAELKPAASGRQGAADASPSSAPAAGPTAGGAVATAPQPSGSGRSSWSGSVGPGGTGSGAGGAPASGTSDLVEWEAQVHVLEAAINEAKDANVGVSKAKRLLKEMQAQAAAAEAARQLEAVMSRRPAGSGALRGALSKAEEAAAALSSAGGAPVLNEVLLPLIQAGRRRMEMERAAEALHKAAGTCRALPDLPRLEAAILTARKLGAEELDAESYRVASDTLGKLHEAARCRAALDAAVKALGRGLRGNEDAEAVERLLADATRWGEGLLAPDVARARESLEHWRSQTASEARLARALNEGSSTQSLARVIQEAAASGVKVQGARRVLKLMQGVEAAMLPSPDGAAAQATILRSRIEAAEQAGVVSPLMASARRMLWRLGAAAAREALDAALRPHSDWPLAQRLLSLKTALARAEAVIGAPLSALQGGSSEAAGAAEEKVAVGVAAPADDEAQADGSSSRRVSSDAEAGAGPAPLPAAVTADGAARAAGAAKHSAGGGATSAADQGSSTATSPAAAAATVGIADATATVTASHSPSASHVVAAPGRSSAAASDAQVLEQSGATSTAALAASDNAMHSSGSQAAADAPAVAPMTPEDEAAVSALAELAGKAWRVVEEDERQAARLDAEKAAAEKARREQVERDKQERLKQEQARQQKEKAELAERDRAAAEKRDKAKAEKGKATVVLAKSLGSAKGGGGGSAGGALPTQAGQGGSKAGAGGTGAKGSAKGGEVSDGKGAGRRGAAATAAPQPVSPPLANGWAPYGPPPPPPPPRAPPSADPLTGGNASVSASTPASSAPPTPGTNGVSEFAHPAAMASALGAGQAGMALAGHGALELPPMGALPPAVLSNAAGHLLLGSGLTPDPSNGAAAGSAWGGLGLGVGLSTPASTLSLLAPSLHASGMRNFAPGPLLVAHGRMDSTESLGEAALAALDSDMLLALELGGAAARPAAAAAGGGSAPEASTTAAPGAASKAGGQVDGDTAAAGVGSGVPSLLAPTSNLASGLPYLSAGLGTTVVGGSQPPSSAATPMPSSPRTLPLGLPPMLDATVPSAAASGTLADSLAAMSPCVPSQVQAAWGTAPAPAPFGTPVAAAVGPSALGAVAPPAPSAEASWGSGIGSQAVTGDSTASSHGAAGIMAPGAVMSTAAAAAGGPLLGHGGGGSGRGFGAGVETASQHTCSSHFSSATSADELMAGSAAAAGGNPPLNTRQLSLPRPPVPQPAATNGLAADASASGLGSAFGYAVPATATVAPVASAAASSAITAGPLSALGAINAPSKPKIEFVDLGGASWGLDSPLLAGPTGGVSSSGLLMLPTLQELSSAWQQLPAPSSTPNGLGAGAAYNPLSPLWGLPAPAASGPGDADRPGSAPRRAAQGLSTHLESFLAGAEGDSGRPRSGGTGVGSIAAAAGAAVANGMAAGGPGSPTPGHGHKQKQIDWPASEMLAMAAAAAAAGSAPLSHAHGAASAGTPTRGAHHSGASGGAGAAGGSTKTCRYFLSGFCRDGERCRFVHPGAGGEGGVAQGKAASAAPALPLGSIPQQQQHRSAAALKLAQAMQKQVQGVLAASPPKGFNAAAAANGHPMLPDELSFSPSVSPRVTGRY